MKASRRQQLRTNELAQSLADAVEFVKANSGAVVVGAAAVVLIVALVIYWYSATVAAGQRGWADFYGSQLPSVAPDARLTNLKAVATTYKDPGLVASAWLSYGDAAYQRVRSAGVSPTAQQQLYSEAIQAYQRVITDCPDQLLAVAGARFKLASMAEDRRQWDEARSQYRAIVDDTRFEAYPQKAMASEALARLDEISQQVVFAAPPPTTAPAVQTRPAAASKPAVTIAAPKMAPKTQPATKPVK